MDDIKSTAVPADKNWDQYWRGMKDGVAPGIGGANHPRLNQFWREYFSRLHEESNQKRIIDIASGDGAVATFAYDVLGVELADVTCIDISQHAIDLLQKRFPAIHGIASDAISIPLESASFDIVTSQFGVEYAGVAAFIEAARLVAPGGQLAVLAHHRSGAIYRECSASIDAVEKLRACEFIPRSIAMFEAGFAAGRGADPGPYNRAAEDLLPAFRELERIMQDYGMHVAGDTLLRLYQDVDKIHQSMQHYDPAEILQWLSRMDGELDAYAGMMVSMRNAALSEPQFRAVGNELESAGFSLLQALPLTPDDKELPIAWALIANRPPKPDSDDA
jgi:ubiquinone/menaquinone biosynthesis C-methylase UbiE